MSDYFRQNGQINSYVGDRGWVVLTNVEQQIKNKVEALGTPLSDWNIKIYRGILTGYNEAFLISQEIRDRLVQDSPISAEIIRPILRGRDVQKYSAQWDKKYLIVCHTGYTNGDGQQVPPIKIEKFSAVKKHLDQYWTQLEKRLDQGISPYHLRSCIYMDDFSRSKIVWGEISDRSKFAFDDSGFFVEATSFLMTGEKLKYLLGMLNSKLLEWYFNQIGTATGVGTNRWKKYTIQLLPIVQPNATMETYVTKCVDQILTGNTSKRIETIQHLDNYICQMYQLSEEEIDFVKGLHSSNEIIN